MRRLGVEDLFELERMPPERRAELLRDRGLQSMITGSSALYEAEVLLGRKTAEQVLRAGMLIHAVQRNDLEEIGGLLCSGADILQRDDVGCMAAHYCRSELAASLLR